MLFSHNIAVLPDIERQFNIYIFINDSSAIAFNGVTVIHQLLQISADRFFRNIIQLAQFTYNNSSVGLQFFQDFISSLNRKHIAASCLCQNRLSGCSAQAPAVYVMPL